MANATHDAWHMVSYGRLTMPTETLRVTTTAELKTLAKQAEEVFFAVRFGCTERYVKVSKKETFAFIAEIDGQTAEELEVYGGYMASYIPAAKCLFIG